MVGLACKVMADPFTSEFVQRHRARRVAARQRPVGTTPRDRRQSSPEAGGMEHGMTRPEEAAMAVLVTYASRHGATQGIAERIGETLRANGLDAETRPAASVRNASAYDAFVIGSAAYMEHWLKDAKSFVDRNRDVLAARPVWLFSSGPIGPDPVDKHGVDQKVAAVPKEAPELVAALHARDHHVFFGAYDPDQKPVGMVEGLGMRFMKLMPAAREAIPAGDFRDWPEIESWATAIAHELLGQSMVPAGR